MFFGYFRLKKHMNGEEWKKSNFIYVVVDYHYNYYIFEVDSLLAFCIYSSFGYSF